MASFTQFLRRDDSNDELTPTMAGLLIALLCLVLLGMTSIFALLVLKRIRSQREAAHTLPMHHSSPSMSHLNAPAKRGHRRTLTITSTPYAAPHISYSDSEKAAFLSEKNSPPGSPVPEIHITFPEEQGEKRGSRVVVVKITDNGGVGLEPYKDKDDQLPRYEQREGEFRSLDLERLGGLKESEKRWG